jgi:hypothetical protein
LLAPKIISEDMVGFLIAADVRQALAMTHADQETFDEWRANYQWRDELRCTALGKGAGAAAAAAAGAAEAAAVARGAGSFDGGGGGLPPVGRGLGAERDVEAGVVLPSVSPPPLHSQQQAGEGPRQAERAGSLQSVEEMAENHLSELDGTQPPQPPPRRTPDAGAPRPRSLVARSFGLDGSARAAARGLASRSVPLGGLARRSPIGPFPRGAGGAPVRWPGGRAPAARAALSIQLEPIPACRPSPPPALGPAAPAAAAAFAGESCAALRSPLVTGVGEPLSYALPAHLLRSASRQGRDLAEAFIDKRYHCRGPEDALVGLIGSWLSGSCHCYRGSPNSRGGPGGIRKTDSCLVISFQFRASRRRGEPSTSGSATIRNAHRSARFAPSPSPLEPAASPAPAPLPSNNTLMQGASGIVIAGPVPFDGHILVFGPVSSVEGLFSMLAPLRRCAPRAAPPPCAPSAACCHQALAFLHHIHHS